MPGAVLIKPIKPSRLEVEAMQRVMEDEANSIANEMILDMTAATAFWKRSPKFDKIVSVAGSKIEILIYCDDEIFAYVELGTKPHLILPQNAYALRFKSGYKRKTIPNRLTSRPGGAFGEDRFSAGVIHPGSKAANLFGALEKAWKRKLPKRINDAMARVARVSGHAMK